MRGPQSQEKYVSQATSPHTNRPSPSGMASGMASPTSSQFSNKLKPVFLNIPKGPNKLVFYDQSSYYHSEAFVTQTIVEGRPFHDKVFPLDKSSLGSGAYDKVQWRRVSEMFKVPAVWRERISPLNVQGNNYFLVTV